MVPKSFTDSLDIRLVVTLTFYYTFFSSCNEPPVENLEGSKLLEFFGFKNEFRPGVKYTPLICCAWYFGKRIRNFTVRLFGVTLGKLCKSYIVVKMHKYFHTLG